MYISVFVRFSVDRGRFAQNVCVRASVYSDNVRTHICAFQVMVAYVK